MLAASVLSAGGCMASAPSLVFGPCPASMDPARSHIPAERADPLEFGCTRVTVPLSHENPSGEQLTLAVARVRHRERVDSAGALVLLGVALASPG